MPPKRKRSSVATDTVSTSGFLNDTPILPPGAIQPPPPKRQASRRSKVDTNPDHNADIVDGKTALRASPDADEKGEALDINKIELTTPAKTNGVKRVAKKEESDSPLSDIEAPSPSSTPAKKPKKTPTKSSLAAKKGSDEIKAFKAEQAAKKAVEVKVKKEDDGDEWDKRVDPDGDDEAPVEDVDTMKKEAARPPPVNSDYLPLPWKGRLGYACLNTYLRFSNPPVFTSRTCRIASILEHRHPLKDPSQPEHATKNRPDKTQPASVLRGQRYVEELCLANVRDLPKMLRWNHKYGIKFMRLSSEMFPFASHAEYGYKLAPFASAALAEVGKVVAELGHRVSTHPGQFTQLGSPRKEVIVNAIRDLEYHDEMLSLLKLPEQSDRDAVMILHMGGTFGDKAATLDRFRENYRDLSPSIKRRLVLENDDVSWSVHDLLPVCEELNIPLCLDFHHHNIIFDSTQLREGTLDIMSLYPRIKATWERKNITQKMHYSEGCPEAITGRQRRKHNPRPITLPPCPNDMDLMIEAKDKEQAVFELMRTLKLPGWDTFNNIIPYERDDDNKPLPKKVKKKKTKKQIAAEIDEFGKELSEEEEAAKETIPDEEVGMGGKENRVYWPVSMEEWLRPKRREVKKKGGEDEAEMFKNPTPANFEARKKITAKNKAPLDDEVKDKLEEANNLADVKAIIDEMKARRAAEEEGEDDGEKSAKKTKSTPAKEKKAPGSVKKATPAKKKNAKNVPTPSLSNVDEEEDDEDLSMVDLSDGEEDELDRKIMAAAPTSVSGRSSVRARGKKMSYAEPDVGSDEE
ncbi:UV-endonuclease UvdE [Mollisia scopiformis]|uniref:UV-endonuclease UvdE n=1 Tax=Mollisia scopiformis TaxID=149040 RepID=A0A194XKK3_MOLSC|nr:UV-endonuclease UvdE [Mollisia scopiformis]KUJ20688.1 UV-endonuclease UvdE [Mollisia scopiformis]